MAKIFISYRRDDSAYATGVIRDQLVRQLTDCEVFFDVDSIPYGVDFRQHLESSVAACDFLVAVIGKSWLTAVDNQGQRRLDNPNDAVRVEVETALRGKIPLVPVFLDGIPVPPADTLPDSLRELVGRNAIFVRPPPDFNHNVDKLVLAFQRWLAPEASGDGQTASVRPAAPRRRRALSGRLLALIVLLAASALGGWWLLSAPAGPPDYELGEMYLYEDSDANAVPWQPRSRMLDGGFKMPVHYVHWVVLVTHAKNMRPVQIPVECRLLNSTGEVVKFRGLFGDLPDTTYPHSGKTEWIFTFGSRDPIWKPDNYTLQLGTPTKSAHISFEVLPP